MMLVDLEKNIETDTLKCDICVVGTGAAGLAIASELLKTDLKVIFVESGGLQYEKATQSLYDTEISGLAHPGSTRGRLRMHGGSTTRWGGQALPLTPLDFEKREWVPHSGWPISFDDLTPYYERANQFLLVDSMNFDTDLFAHLKAKPPNLDYDQLIYHFSKWSAMPDLREIYLTELSKSKNCILLLHANVTKIVLENARYVTQLVVRSLTNNHAVIQARKFVLCVGGIETARLLLFNKIGNQYDLVGRYFQDHPSGVLGVLKTTHPKQVQKLFNTFHKNNLMYSVRCTAAPQWQRAHQALNISCGIHFIQESNAFNDLRFLYRAIHNFRFNKEMLRKTFRITKNFATCFSSIVHYFLYGRSYHPNAKFHIGFTTEQEPNFDSRILLSTRQDALGMPLSNVQWKLTELTLHTIQRFAKTLQAEFKKANIGEVECMPWVHENTSEWQKYITDQFHHMGTTRMHDSPRYGVVDRECRIHGVENLYIGGSSVFPTGGHSNSALTLIALCLRLADKLKINENNVLWS